MASDSAFDTRNADQRVKTLVNAQLKSILKKEKLAVSGLKAAMQSRITSRSTSLELQNHAKNRDLEKFNRLKSFINNPEALRSPAPSLPSSHSQYPEFHPNVAQKALLPPIVPPGSVAPIKPMFKESPFYTILESLTDVHECKALVREATRDQVDCKIILRPDIADKLLADPSIRVMIYCASEPISHFAKVDIAFPHQVEIKVNLDEVKANLRGLKNKPGSTRPPDITSLLRKRANYENSLSLTYALTHKKFYFLVNLVKRHPVEELVARLKSGKTISKDQVIREMVSKAQDSEVQATGANVSLKCPLSTLRIEVPCRSTICTHNQCFDALSFLQLQEQAPTWTCPVCNKIVNFEALEVDLFVDPVQKYIDNILQATPKSVDQVTVEPDGKWSRIAESDASPQQSHDSSEDDEDLVEIKDTPRIAAVKSETNSGINLMGTPPASSREQSSSSVPPPSTGAKRSASAVIDLTSDDDDEQGNPRSSKRPALPAYSTNPSSHRSENTRPLGLMSFDTPLPPYNASDPHATFLSSSCFDLLLIEMVPLVHRMATESSATRTDSTKALDEEEQREAAFRRLDTLGYRVGQGLAERFSRDRPRFTDTLDMIKFLCKDLWTLIFRKQIDNLKTNHRGVYVLTDNTFRPLTRMSMSSRSEAVYKAQPFLWFPCGVVRGALATMGIDTLVQAETSELPRATFQIKIISAKG
ncbi:MAG: hypothetical protein Q9208_007154 [Pyrenodesmia sp. 3 TL-2023]